MKDMKLESRFNLNFSVWLVLFITTWAFVLMPGDMNAPRIAAACWLIAQAIAT